MSLAIVAEQALVQGVLASVVALFAFARTVESLAAARASLFPALAPAVAVVIGMPLVGEAPQGLQWLGVAAATLGMAAAVWGGGGRSHAAD